MDPRTEELSARQLICDENALFTKYLNLAVSTELVRDVCYETDPSFQLRFPFPWLQRGTAIKIGFSSTRNALELHPNKHQMMIDISLRPVCILELDRGEHALLAFIKWEQILPCWGRGP